jgi:hypothetical protein
MNLIFKIAAIGAVFFLSACGHHSESHSATTTTYDVNGMKPEDYFRQFLYRQTGQCGTIHEVHRYAKSETFKIGVNSAGKDALASLSIILKDDGTYRAFYQEIIVSSYFSDGSGYYWGPQREKVVSGLWGIYGDRLALSALGQATALQYNGRPAMQLVPESDIFSAGLKGRVLLIRLIDASYNPIPESDPCVRK